MFFKNYFKRLRAQYGYTQKQMATLLAINLETIKKIETGQTKTPSKILLNRLCLLTKKNEIEVLSQILFGIDCDDEDDDFSFEHYLECYCTSLYIQGWSVLDHSVKNIKLEDDVCVINCKGSVKLSSKANASKIINVISFDDEVILPERFVNDPEERIDFYKELFSYSAFPEQQLKEIHVLFRNQVESEVQSFNKIKKEQRIVLKTPVKAILFDVQNYNVIDEFRIL